MALSGSLYMYIRLDKRGEAMVYWHAAPYAIHASAIISMLTRKRKARETTLQVAVV